MANLQLDVELVGEVRVLEALAGVDKQARFAQKTALRAAGRKGRSIVAKSLASRFRVPMKLFKKRARFYTSRARSKASPIAAARLWLGLAAQLRANEHASVGGALRAKFPKGFSPRLKSGHSGWFHREKPPRRVGVGAREKPRQRHALPIKEHTIDFSPGAENLMVDTSRKVMRTIYPDTFRKDYKRRVDKIRARNR